MSAPGVVPEPIVLILDAPLPKVLVVLIPVAKVLLPEEVKVVNAPLPWEVIPIVVKFPAAGVVIPIVLLLMVAPVMVPPVMAIEEVPKLLAVTRPLPKVTGRLVTVLMERVVAVVRSITGEAEEILVETLFRVTTPVPVEKVLAPVIVVAPFKLIAPVPVPKVFAPD